MLKARFRILQGPMRYQEVEKNDNIFWTCCIIHNMLHTYNSMDEMVADLHWAGAGGDPDDDVGESTGAAEPTTEAPAPDSILGVDRRYGHGRRGNWIP